MTEAPRSFLPGTPLPQDVYVIKKQGEWPLHIFSSPEGVIGHLQAESPRGAALWQIWRVRLSDPHELEYMPPGKALLREKPQKEPPPGARWLDPPAEVKGEWVGYGSGGASQLDAGSSGAVIIAGGDNLAGGMKPQDRHG